MKIKYSKEALKFLAKTEKPMRERIINGINNLPYGDVKTLQGYSDNRQRLRIGKYRIIYKCMENTVDMLLVFVIDIASRGDIYK